MKTHLLKPIFLFTLALTTAVLTGASLLAPSAWADEPTYPMPQTRFDNDPAKKDSITSKEVLKYGFDSDGNEIPVKTLRITNSSTQTVYPIMRDPNDGPYDPYDKPLKEYRGYIGYKDEQSGQYYFGLKGGASILVRVPLVFWNGGRIAIGLDGQYLAKTGLPLLYDRNSARSIANAESPGSDGTIKNGVVMWYRSENLADFNPDAEDQLAEFTVRDHEYLIKVKDNEKIPDSEFVTLFNFNVSNVDSLYLPLAMEATDVWVLPQVGLRTGWSPPNPPVRDVYGWTGAINPIDDLQGKIQQFTADNNKLLGEYFGEKRQGWPFYNIPSSINDPKAPRKIPSGASIFPQSPLKGLGDRSSYNSSLYLISSDGSEPGRETISSSGNQSNLANNQVRLSENEPPSKIDFVHKNQIATANPGCEMPAPAPCVRLPNAIQRDTEVTAFDRGTRVVTLSKPLVPNTTIVGSSITFERPVDDYASKAMIRLWYSWAQYYLKNWNKTPKTRDAPTEKKDITGSIEKNMATLKFNEKHEELVEGMAVKGPGLDNALTEGHGGRSDPHQGNAVILQIAIDKMSVILSQVANETSQNRTFSVYPPEPFCAGKEIKDCLGWAPIAKGDPGYPLIDEFKFSNEELRPERNPYEFSQQVYLIMASMNQIGKSNNGDVFKFMQDIIGANMAYIFTNDAKKIGDAQMVIAMIRDLIKSVLRGVSDFTKYPDTLDKEGNHTSWYPNPAEHRGGQRFNVFNLDPYVWFVHVPLGFTSYGFSIDDDVGNIGAGGASQLQITVGGTCGLKNTNQWTQQAAYGPVESNSLHYSGPASLTNGDTVPYDIKSVSNTTPVTITTAGKPNLSNLEEVRVQVDVNGNRPWVTFKAVNVTSETFELYTIPEPNKPSKPVAPTDYTFVKGYTWSYPLHPYVDTGELTKVFYRVKADEPDGTFLGAFVRVNGVDRNKAGKKFRVWALGKQKDENNNEIGRLLLADDLTDAEGKPLKDGNYNFTFFELRPEPAPPPKCPDP